MSITRKRRGSVEESVRDYLKLHPETYSFLKGRVVNVSKLARDIKGKYPDFNISSIRYSLNKFMEESSDGRTDLTYVEELLMQSKVTLQDKITVLMSVKPLNVNYISATYLTDSVVYIVDELKNGKLPLGNQVTVERDVSAIHIFSPKEIERVPGFVMRITERLYSSGINVLQLISCSNETIIVIRRSDGVRAYETLVLS